MKKLGLIVMYAAVLIFVVGLYAPAHADRLEVLPTDHDFGDVEVGTTVSTIISMTNINGADVTVFRVEFQAGSSGDFSLANVPPIPFVIVPNEVVQVEVAFTPSASGYVSAVLEIESSDTVEPVQTVFFGGVGVAVQPPPVTIQAILDFFDESVEAGALQARGRLPIVAEWRLNRFRNMIVIAGVFIDNGWNALACWQLERADKRSDGAPWPLDLVEGDACAELNAMILELMADLGCE